MTQKEAVNVGTSSSFSSDKVDNRRPVVVSFVDGEFSPVSLLHIDMPIAPLRRTPIHIYVAGNAFKSGARIMFSGSLPEHSVVLISGNTFSSPAAEVANQAPHRSLFAPSPSAGGRAKIVAPSCVISCFMIPFVALPPTAPRLALFYNSSVQIIGNRMSLVRNDAQLISATPPTETTRMRSSTDSPSSSIVDVMSVVAPISIFSEYHLYPESRIVVEQNSISSMCSPIHPSSPLFAPLAAPPISHLSSLPSSQPSTSASSSSSLVPNGCAYGVLWGSSVTTPRTSAEGEGTRLEIRKVQKRVKATLMAAALESRLAETSS